MSNKIHACPALDTLVAEKVMGWHLVMPSQDCIPGYQYWLSPSGKREVYPPHWSSDPGEALRLLADHNRSQASNPSPWDSNGKRVPSKLGLIATERGYDCLPVYVDRTKVVVYGESEGHDSLALAITSASCWRMG